MVEKAPTDVVIGLNLIYLYQLGQTKNGQIFQVFSKCNNGKNYIEIQQSNKTKKAHGTYNINIPDNPEINVLVNKYESIFAKSKYDVGQFRNEKCHIPLINDNPICLRSYRHSVSDNQKINTIIEELIRSGLISESTSPYSFPVVLANKKDEGEKTRLCIDYRKLNQITKTESYPFPIIGELLDKTLNCEYFTILDVASGFHHIKMSEESKTKTAFTTFSGKYEWNVMPFGLKNAPIIFQRALHRIINKHKLDKFTSNYMDDIIIFSKNYNEHVEHIESVFRALALENIKLKLSKCQFAQTHVNYLGHRISKNGIEPLQSNIDTIMAIQPPKNVKEVQSLIGHIQYYRMFIPNCSAVLHPITKLLRKNTPFKWEEEQQQTFNKIKKLLTEPPILQIFDPEMQTHIFTDASKKGIGAVLKQKTDNGALKPVAYFSKALQDYQKNYSVPELECLAIVEALDNWKHYVSGRKVIIHSDHAGLRWLHKVKFNNSRLSRWSVALSRYDYEIIHEPGRQNFEADQLSRNPYQLNAFFLNDQTIKDRIKKENTKTIVDNNIPSFCQQGNSTIIFNQKEYVPESLRTELISHSHQDLGHLGARKMLSHITKQYNWPNITKDLEKFVKNCTICATNKSRPVNFNGLFEATQPTEPFQIIQIDSVGGLKQRGTNKRYLHLAIDMFSRKVWHITSKSQQTEDFINLINKIIPEKKPAKIRMDNFPALQAHRFKTFLAKKNIQFEYSPPYSPQSMGIVERVNQTLVNQIRAVINDPNMVNKWTTAADKIVEIYNETIHSSTNLTPNQLNNPDQNNIEMALQNDKASKEKNKKRINKMRKPIKYNVGDRVLILNENALNRDKLAPIYKGPGTIVGNESDSRYRVEYQGKTTTHSARNLKQHF